VSHGARWDPGPRPPWNCLELNGRSPTEQRLT